MTKKATSSQAADIEGAESAFAAELRANAEHPTHAQSVELCRRLTEIDLSDLSVEALIDGAKAAYHAQDLGFARSLLWTAIGSQGRTDAIVLDMALIELRDGNLQAALDLLRECGDLNPLNADAWFHQAFVYNLTNRYIEAVHSAERFLKLHSGTLSKLQTRTLQTVGDRAFEAGERQASSPVLVYLWANDRNQAPNLRVGEAYLTLGQPRAAYEVLKPLFADGALDSWGLCSFATACIESNEPGDAQRAFDALYAKPLRHPHFDSQYLRLLYLREDLETARAFIEGVSDGLTKDQTDRLIFEYRLRGGDISGALDMWRSGEIKVDAASKWLLIELGYKLLAAQRGLEAQVITASLADALPLDDHVIALRIQQAFALQDWDAARAILSDLPDDVVASNPDLQLRWFELYAFLGEYENAESTLQELGAIENLPDGAVPPVLRYLAERKRWDDIVAAAPRVLTPHFDYESVGDILFRATRKVEKHEQIISQIEDVKEWDKHRSLKKLRAILLEDSVKNETDILSILADRHVTEFTWAKARLLAKAGAIRGRGRSAEASDNLIFLCTNGSYLCASAVSLYSMMKENQVDTVGVEYLVVIDDEYVDLCNSVTTKLGDAFGLRVSTLAASKIVPSKEGLSADYGLFTSGHVLDASAYYRIFLAKYAKETLGKHRALYVDSDTVVQGQLTSLFDLDLNGAAVAARFEVDRPEVRKAIVAHGLEEKGYFNSGVLLFDLTSENFIPAIENSVRAIYDENTLLFFHDQCALNIGFGGQAFPLSTEYNSFVTPGNDPSAVAVGASIVHFLDRPKPWDVSYDGPAAGLWFDCWSACSSVIGGSTAIELLEMAQR